jgi:hypothetical protein
MESAMVKKEKIIIRYDGPALHNHEMDVHELAPSLLALGDICRIANETFNGDQAAVKILVRADVEQKCFQLQLEFVQTLYDQFSSLFGHDDIKDAKDLLGLIGLVATGAGTTVVGLMEFYKRICSDKQDSVSIETTARGGSVVYQVIGSGNTVSVSPEVHKLAQDPRMFPAVKRMLSPLGHEGYNKLAFVVDERVTQYFSKDEANAIIRTPEEAIVTKTEKEQVSQIRTSVRVKKAIFEGSSKWSIVYKKAVEAKMADIDWLNDFQSGKIMLQPRCKLIVDLEERVPINDDGEETGQATYTIMKVHGVQTPPNQLLMALSKPNPDD